MTSIVKLEALSGVKDDGPLCYLLQVDDMYILLDCGWDENFDLLYIEAVKKRVPYISAVLISYADPAHLGALPYLVAKCGLTAPIYATSPTYKMGVMFAYDWVSSHKAMEDFTLFSFDDIDAAFDRIQQLKYNQMVSLKGDSGLQITPLPAGHMIGGAIWRISKAGDDEIVYAVDYNHKKERHLNGCLFDAIQRPHLLITDAFNAQYKQPGRKQRDEKLVTKMLRTLREGGDVLVVIDTAGRVLEIAHLLDQLWSNTDAGLSAYNLVMLSFVASSVVKFAQSQVEWMSDKMLKSFDQGRFNPFQFQYVQLCHSHAEISKIRSPKVILCPDLSMETGFSRELFLEWCSDTRNTVIVTGRSGERTLGSKLIRMTEQQGHGLSSKQLTLEIKRRIRLEGAELEDYYAHKLQEQQDEARKKMEAARRGNARAGKTDDSDSDSDDDDLASAVAAVTSTQKGGANGTVTGASGGPAPIGGGAHRSSSTTTVPSTPLTDSKTHFPTAGGHDPSSAHDIVIRWEQTQKASFFKQNKKSFPMFPFTEEKVKWDDYGEVIRPEDYMIDSVVPQSVERAAGPTMDGMDQKSTDMRLKAELDNRLSRDGGPMGEGSSGVLPSPSLKMEDKEFPTKCIKYITKLEILCRVEFIDFEGRSDGESIKKILSQIRPKQLIIIHGDKASTQHLADYARDSGAVQGKIFTPKLGEIVDATVESRIFQVALSDALLSSLSFQKVKDAELVWLDAKLLKRVRDEGTTEKDDEEDNEDDDEDEEEDERMETDADDMVAPLHKRMRSRKAADKFLLDALAANSIPPHQAVFVNEPKLSDVKQVLQAAGHVAEFSAGVLYIAGVASIRRNDAGRFHVEGCASEKFFDIRDLIYKQFAIV